MPDAVNLADGRRLEVRTSGPVDGIPLVFHHGTPGSLIPFRYVERAAHERGLLLVTTSRPGYGGSSRHPGRVVADVVADTDAALDMLGAQRCLVAGWSGGGPHALACAGLLDRAAAVLVIGSVAPYESLDWTAGMGQDNVAEFGAAIQGEDALRSFLDPVHEQMKELTVAGIIESFSSLLSPVDRAALTDEFGEDLAASYREGLRSGIDGWIDDDLAFMKPWGFDLTEVSTPVLIWHGNADLMVPFAHGQWLASRLPGATSHLQPGEGHLSIGLGAIEHMLDELVSAGDELGSGSTRLDVDRIVDVPPAS